MRTVVADPVPQPELEDILGDYNPMTGEAWHEQSYNLWAHLGEFPTIAAGLQSAQWDMLARAVALDDASLGDPKLAGEARQRFQKYGVDPDDLLRLRIQIVAADQAERRNRVGEPPDADSARKRRGPLTAV
jgi:hypothetical protein